MKKLLAAILTMILSVTLSAQVTGNISPGLNRDNVTVDINLNPPNLVLPENGVSHISILPTLEWDAVVNAVSYRVTLASDAVFSNILYNNTTTETSITFAETDSGFPLSNNTTYYWKITAISATNDEVESVVFHFITNQEVPVFHGNPTGGIVYTTPTNFSWYLAQPTTGLKYNIQVTSNSLAGNADWTQAPDFENTTLSTNHSFTLLKGKTYFWRVIVLNEDEEALSYSSDVQFETAGGAEVPVPSWPIGGAAVYSNTPSLSWYLNSYQPDLTYDARYRQDGEINWNDIVDINAMNVTLPELSPGKDYEWQARSVYKRGTPDESVSDYSSIESFVTQGEGTVSAPTASYPVDGVTVYSTSPGLYWYLGQSGAGLNYNVYFKESAAGQFTHAGTANCCYFQLVNLSSATSYDWYVTATNGTDSLSSDTETFVTSGSGQAGYPVSTWPVGNPVMYTDTPSLNWYLEGNASGVIKYVVRWKQDQNSTDWNTVYDGSADINSAYTTSYTFANSLSYGSRWHWAVASYDGSSYSDWSEGSFNIIGVAVAGDPVISWPAGGEMVYSTSVNLSWYLNGSSAGIAGYEVTYSRSDVYAPEVTTTENVSANSLSLSDLVPGATYYWKVRTDYGNGVYSGWSNPEGRFIINTGSNPIQPIVGGPTNVTIPVSSPQLTWFTPSAPQQGTTYNLEISDNPGFASPEMYSNLTSAQQVVNGLQPSASYFWRVTSKDGNGNLSWYSNTGVFKTASQLTGFDEDNITPENFSLEQNYPNPFNPATVINFTLPEQKFVTLRIFDMLGREVRTLISGSIEKGHYSVTWDGRNSSGLSVTSGAYIYRISAGDYISSRKMLLLR